MSQHGKRIHINLPVDLHRKLRIKCAYEDISIQEYVEKLVKDDLARIEIAVREKTSEQISD